MTAFEFVIKSMDPVVLRWNDGCQQKSNIPRNFIHVRLVLDSCLSYYNRVVATVSIMHENYSSDCSIFIVQEIQFRIISIFGSSNGEL